MTAARTIVATAVALGLLAAEARAAGSRVVLLRAPGADAAHAQAETLLAAELRAAGFDVTGRERSGRLDLRAEIEAAALAFRPIAVLAILRDPRGTGAEVWLSDRVTGKLVIRNLTTEPGASDGTAASDLALRAVELLRGSLLELTVEAARPSAAAAPPPADVARFVAQGSRGHRAHFLQGFTVGLGAAMLGTFASVGPSFAPAARLSWGTPRGHGLRLSLVAPGSGRAVRAVDGGSLLGTARVHQELVALEGFLVFRPEARLQPFVAIGAGLHRVRAQGKGAARLFPDGSGSALGAAFQGGSGIAVRLGARASVHLEAQLLAVAPATRVWIADQQVARIGGLSLVLAAGFTTSF